MGALKKARIYDPDQYDDGFYVPFNPNTLTYSAGTSPSHSAEHHDAQDERYHWTQGTRLLGQTGLATLSATLLFYTYETETCYQDVRGEVNRIRAFLRRTDDSGGVLSRKIAFSWGTLTVRGTLESINVSYQMFASDGTPVQAEVAITILGEDPDVCAAGADHAASVEMGKDEVAAWRELGSIPPSVAWLFT